MGKILELKYKSPHSQRIADRVIDKAAAVKATSTAPTPKLEPTVTVAKPEPKAVKPRKARATLAVTNTAVTNADRQASWRSRQDPVALRGQARERMRGLRAQRKTGKAVGS